MACILLSLSTLMHIQKTIKEIYCVFCIVGTLWSPGTFVACVNTRAKSFI